MKENVSIHSSSVKQFISYLLILRTLAVCMLTNVFQVKRNLRF